MNVNLHPPSLVLASLPAGEEGGGPLVEGEGLVEVAAEGDGEVVGGGGGGGAGLDGLGGVVLEGLGRGGLGPLLAAQDLRARLQERRRREGAGSGDERRRRMVP